MRWAAVALLCALAVLPSAAAENEQPSTFWWQRIYNQVDGVIKSIDQVRGSQNELREKLTEYKYTQNQQIDSLTYRVSAMEDALQSSDIKSQTTREWVLESVRSTVIPLLIMLIVFAASGWWKRNVRSDQT